MAATACRAALSLSASQRRPARAPARNPRRTFPAPAKLVYECLWPSCSAIHPPHPGKQAVPRTACHGAMHSFPARHCRPPAPGPPRLLERAQSRRASILEEGAVHCPGQGMPGSYHHKSAAPRGECAAQLVPNEIRTLPLYHRHLKCTTKSTALLRTQRCGAALPARPPSGPRPPWRGTQQSHQGRFPAPPPAGAHVPAAAEAARGLRRARCGAAPPCWPGR